MVMSFDNCGTELPLANVHITSAFWLARLRATKNGALPAMYEQMKKTGRWDCLKLEWKPGEPNKPHRFWDSDVAKWLEAACYTLIYEADPALSTLVEEAVDMIRGAQQEDGYLNTYYTVVEPGKRWTNVAWSHEMYDAGHLLEAALAHHIYSESPGSTRLLSPILKYVQHIRSVFGLEPGQKAGYPGHEELELALLKTYEYLKAHPSNSEEVDPNMLLELADYFIEERGRVRDEGHYFEVEARARGEKVDPGPAPRGEPLFSYYQADDVLRNIESVNGHSVRAMYWLTAVANLARLKKDETTLEAAERLWQSATERKMYISGGLGAIGEWEGFGKDYYLPNESGYVETCAAIGLVLFAHQMLLVNPRDVRYAHLMERALYDAVLVGMSLDGKSFFYENPLATIGKTYQRSDWFEVSCCPPNVARLLNSLSKYVYTFTSDDDTLHVHMLVPSTVDLVLSNGQHVQVIQEGRGPWTGGATFIVNSQARSTVKIAVRKPEGTASFKVSTVGPYAGQLESRDSADGVIVIESVSTGSALRFTVEFEFLIQRLLPHPLNLDNYHHIAFARGPFVYCAETTDNTGILDLRAIRISADAPVREVIDRERFSRWGLEEVVLLKLPASMLGVDGGSSEVELTLIPLFLWANRGKSDLRVWLPLSG